MERVCAAVSLALLLISTTATLFVEGLPILGPDLNRCKPLIFPKRNAGESMDCCVLDTSKPIKDFKFNLELPLRVRRPAHELDAEFIRKYERAVELMKALPPEDPRSHTTQANLHCSYCAGAYNQFNSSHEFAVHFDWFVMPFHRWYLYFHERILATLLGDDTFAIPYWAWDVQGEHAPPANIMPHFYVNKNSSLYHEKRSALHQPPCRADLEYWASKGIKDPDVLLHDNLYVMWRTMIGDVKTPEAFYGGKVSLGDDNAATEGVFESAAHAAIHIWIGDENQGGEDTGPAQTSARDPIFFAHYSQIDRLWLMWKSWGGKDLDSLDWLDTEFLFYDENADLVRVNVRDSLNFDNFRVTYEQVEADWVNYRPKSIREIDPKYVQVGILRRFLRKVRARETFRNIAMALERYFQPEENGTKISFGGVKRGVVTSWVFRPELIKSTSTVDASLLYDEVLVITGVVEKPFNVEMRFFMFLELPEAGENTPHHCVEYLGSIAAEAEGLSVGMSPTVTRKFSTTISIGDRLQMLDIIRQKSVTVTCVPAWDPKHDSHVSVRVTDLTVEMRPL